MNSLAKVFVLQELLAVQSSSSDTESFLEPPVTRLQKDKSGTRKMELKQRRNIIR